MQPAEANDPIPDPSSTVPVSVLPKDEPLPAGGSGGSQAQPFDFRQPTFLTAAEMRRLKAGCAEFAQNAASRLTNYLQSDVDLKLVTVAPERFKTFNASLPTPTHMSLFRLDPLRGVCVFQVDVGLGLLLADRLMGGAATAPEEGRALGELEATLLDQVVTVLVETWCVQWASWQACQPVLLGHENDARYLSSSTPDANVLAVKIEAKLGEVTGSFQMIFPFRTLDPLFRHIRQQIKQGAETPGEGTPTKAVRWDARYEDLPVSVTARFPSFQLPARRISRLAVGEVLSLPADYAQRVQMSLAGLNRLTGRLGTREGHWAVEIASLGLA